MTDLVRVHHSIRKIHPQSPMAKCILPVATLTLEHRIVNHALSVFGEPHALDCTPVLYQGQVWYVEPGYIDYRIKE